MTNKFSPSHWAKAGIGFWLSSQKNNIERFIFCLLILLLPTQLGKHFWPDFSKVLGIRVDYLSPTIYTTDILIVFLFIVSTVGFFARSKNKLKTANNKKQVCRRSFLNILNFNCRFAICYLLFAVLLIVGVFLSKSPTAGLYGLLKISEFVFLGIYISKNLGKLKLNLILLFFSIGIIFESSLTILQFLNQQSMGGIFYLFGERTFSSQTPGIANASINGELILRPYGTFPHPNVLAGYLTIVMAIVISNFQFPISNLRKSFYYLAIAIGTTALLLTLSRVAIALWLIILVSYFIRKFKNHKSYILILLAGLLIIVGLATPLGSRLTRLSLTDESIIQRKTLIQSSLLMIKDNPIFGVGLNNFLINLSYYQKQNNPFFYLQPVHNLFLLIISEIGAVGFLFVFWFIAMTIKKMKEKNEFQISNFKFQILSIVFVLGLFDHYFLTLQQGQLLLSLVLGFCWSKKN